MLLTLTIKEIPFTADDKVEVIVRSNKRRRLQAICFLVSRKSEF